ncbi:choice-of-anchor M domain-containing protein [Micromonospora sp. NBC_01655]|uniref:choice-of-anchor M domain-containing protein n=1 Tax=Micromonospora sp. NBC_01655 TaxID=2975983 RepID=UPI00224EC431|nr:choice-of-anchor M domain-containing protein [Micromonospora sp. NBC_01655]MCX4471377.1 choice-of-anchor M domain-containing protein [Micromonospora sp. NBC_01655]
MRKPIRMVLATGMVAAGLLAAAPPAQADVVTFSSGHLDLVDIAYEAGELELGVHDEDNDVEYAPDEVKIVVKRQAKVTVPNDPAFDFLGTPGVSQVWVLPEIQNTDLVWPGIAAEEVEAGTFTADALALHVRSVSGPGQLAIYTENAVGQPTVLVDSGDGLPDTIALTAGDHLHANWAFDRAGTYRVTFRATGTLAATGQRVTSEATTLRVVVQA